MKHISINIDECFLADEIVRMSQVLKYHRIREKHRQALLNEMDRDLPDYKRETCPDTLDHPPKRSIPWFKYMLP